MEVFEIYKDTANEYRWRLKAPNGKIIAVGEGYSAKKDCNDSIGNVKQYARGAKVVDLTVLPY
jgi:uncharacterized protein